MKKWVSLAAILLVAGFVILNTGCVPTEYPPVENLNYEVVNDKDGNYGGGIKVTWSAPADADPDEYIVSVDDEDQVAVTVLEDYVYTPGVEIEVFAVYGDEKSTGNPTIEFKTVETKDFHVWSVLDPLPGHPSGFGFNVANGSVTSYSVAKENEDNWPKIDYYIADDGGPVLAAPMDHIPSLNNKGSAASEEATDYDALEIVKPKGNYSTQRKLEINAVYGLWLDEENDSDPTGDFFGKLQVSNIDGYDVTLRVALQLEPGLRWVIVTD